MIGKFSSEIVLSEKIQLSLHLFNGAMKKDYKHVTCQNCEAKGNSLFAHFDCDETTCLNNDKTARYYKKGQTIFLAGSTPRGVFCLNKGKIKIFSLGEEGKEQIIHIAAEGEIVGFRAMFSGDPYIVSAETLEECTICFISKEDFLSMIDSNAVLRNGIMKELSKELSERAKFITNMAQKSVKDRLAFSLVMLQDIYGSEPINLSREDLANFVGTATETLIRLLTQFKTEGFIRTETRKLWVIDREALIELSGNYS